MIVNQEVAPLGKLTYELIDIKTLSGVTDFVFSNLNGAKDQEYLIEGTTKGTVGTDSQIILANGDTTTSRYGQYAQLQETDGYNHHLSNWGGNSTISRSYDTSPYITTFKAIVNVFPNYGITWRSEFSMLNAGWGEIGGWYYYTSMTNLTSLTIRSTVSNNLTGTLKLYKRTG